MAVTTKGDGFKVSSLRARGPFILGGRAYQGGATVRTELTKAITGFTDTTAKDVLTVTVPNATHTAFMIISVLGVMGAGGAVGAGETSRLSQYQLVVTRTSGLAAVITLSSAVGGVQSKVAGADNITSVVVTASSVTGANSATQTFTVKVAITKAAGAADNHTAVFSATLTNQNAAGCTFV